MTRAESASSPGTHPVNGASEHLRRLPPAWLVALVAIGLYWLALGIRHAGDIPGDLFEGRPFVYAGLNVVAAIGLLAGGNRGRVIAVLIAVAGAALALYTVVFIAVKTVTDADAATPSLNEWGFLAIYLGIAAGYVLVLARARRGR